MTQQVTARGYAPFTISRATTKEQMRHSEARLSAVCRTSDKTAPSRMPEAAVFRMLILRQTERVRKYILFNYSYAPIVRQRRL